MLQSHRLGLFESGSRFRGEHFEEVFAYQDLPFPSSIAQARGQIHGVADGGEIAPRRRADRADHGAPAMDADAEPERPALDVDLAGSHPINELARTSEDLIRQYRSPSRKTAMTASPMNLSTSPPAETTTSACTARSRFSSRTRNDASRVVRRSW